MGHRSSSINIDNKVTVNFENVGKKVINADNIELVKVYERS